MRRKTMSKTLWKKELGGSLKIYQQERSQFMQMTFYVSPNYYVNDKHKKNGMFVKSLKPITTKLDAEREAKKIFKDFDIEKFTLNRSITTFDEVAQIAFATRSKHYARKERKKLKHNPTFISMAVKEKNRYNKEIKPVFGRLNIADRKLLQDTLDDYVDNLTTIGNKDGVKLQENTIAKYLNIIGFIQQEAIGSGLLKSRLINPALDRRSNARPAYRMLELKKITDQMMKEFEDTQDLFFLELHDYVQFLIASPTRYGMETITLQKKDVKLLQTRDGIKVLHVLASETKTGSHSYESSPEFLDKYGQRFLEKFEKYKDDDYIWFSDSQKSRSTIQERVRKNFVRISDKLDLYIFNGQKRPMTSIRHASMQRMEAENIRGVNVALVHNTSEDMQQKHYAKESDDRSIVKRFEKIYASRLKRQR